MRPTVVSTMKSKIEGFDAVFSGYRWRNDGNWGFGCGCTMLNRKCLSNIFIKCYEFRNGQLIAEDEMIEMDLFRMRARVRHGIFIANKHFNGRQEYLYIDPKPIKGLRGITNNLLIRYILLKRVS